MGLFFLYKGVQADLGIGVIEVVDKGRFFHGHVLCKRLIGGLVQELFDAQQGIGGFLVEFFTQRQALFETLPTRRQLIDQAQLVKSGGIDFATEHEDF